MNRRKKHFAKLRVKEKRNKPPTKAQKRNKMSTYLKNMGTWKQTQLKSKTYKEIEKLFEIEMKRVNTFIPMDQDEESSKKHEDENRSKREGEVLESDMSKKQKMNEQEESDKHEEVKKDDDPEEDEMKKHIADGSSKRYSSIIKMIQSIDKEDLEVLWNLVKTKHGDTRPEDEFERKLEYSRINIKFRGGLLGSKDFKDFLLLSNVGSNVTTVSIKLVLLVLTAACAQFVLLIQGALIKTLEIQIGQMSKVLQERGFRSLPSSTETNLRDQFKLILITVEANMTLIRRIGSPQYAVSTKRSYGPQFLEAYSYGASHIDNSIPRKEKDPENRMVIHPNGIAKNVLVGIGKFIFPLNFIILDMPEDVKVPLILGRPFLSTTHAKIDVFKRKITLRVGDEKIIFKSMKLASSLIKRVYMLSLRERMKLDLEARLIGETLVLNRSLDPLYRDYIELNDLNVPLDIRRDQVDDLMPTVEEGECRIWMATEIKTWEISFLESHYVKLHVWKQEELEDRVMARMEEQFDQFVDQLSDRMDQMMNRHSNHNVQGTDDEQLENPFREDDNSFSDEQSGRRPRQNQREDNRRWESGMRVNILDFARDPLSLKGFIDWLVVVEEVFEFKEVPENKRVLLIATKLRGASGLSNVASCFAPSQAKSECKKAGKRHLFTDSEGDDDAAYEEYEEAPVYDEKPECEEEYMSRDVGVNLVVRRSCLTPKDDGDNWLKHNIFQLTCTILGKFEDELEMGDDVFVLKRKEVAEDCEIPEAMIPLLEEFLDVFPDELPNGLPPLRDIQHHIDLEPGSQLPNRPHYRMSPGEHEEFCRQKDGTWRMYVDSRAINKITMRYRFPIPRLDDLLDQISGATIFTKLDLNSGYYHIHLRPGDEWKTAFKTREGLYEWLVIPFGLSNAPSTFMRVMNQLFRPFIGKFVVVYFDDILIYSASFNEHVTYVRQVLTLLRKDSFYAAIKKCMFMIPKFLFLGYVVSGDGIHVDESKVAAVQEWPTPTTITEVRSFHGLASFYRRFIPNFSSIMAPLIDCMKGKSFVWTEEAELAFQVVKEKLTTTPNLILPDFSKVFELHTDASKVAIGGVLSQGGRPIAYYRKKLTEPKSRHIRTQDKVDVVGLDVIRDMVTVDPYFLVVLQGVQAGEKLDFFLHDGFLFKWNQLCIPDSSLHLQIIKELHDEGHVGRDRTLQLVQASYFYPTMRKEMDRYVKRCRVCRVSKGTATNVGLYMPFPVPLQPWVDISMDFVLGLPRTQRGMYTIYMVYLPLLSLGNLLRCLVGDHVKAWDQKLCQFEFAHNHSVNRSTGFSLFQDFFAGLHDVHKAVHDNLVRVNSNYKQDANHKRRHVDFEEGDFVWVVLTKDHFALGEYNKLSAKKIGPLEIVEKINSNAYHLKLPSHIRCSDVFNVKHLIIYHGDTSDDDLYMNSRTNFVYPGGMMEAQVLKNGLTCF
ncbi:putative nucleotidyltransferase, ribonuclease H [Tanacetum coccineum]